MIASDASNDDRTRSKRREGWRQTSIARTTRLRKSPVEKGRIKEDEADAIQPHPHGDSPVEIIPGKRDQRENSSRSRRQ
jgi:hypothetical protein